MGVQDVILPDIGEGVTEGELVSWLVKPGDKVEIDQAVAEVMTDKATVEVPSPIAGVVKELKAKEGDIIPIETTMLTVDADGKTTSPAINGSSASPQPPKPSPTPSSSPATVAPSGGMEVYPPVADSRVLATPSTRRLAREMTVDINSIQGSGLAGRVTREDIISSKGGSAAPQPLATKSSPGAVEERVALKGVRKKIAENLQKAKHIIPHFTLMEEVNVTELVKIRTQAKAAGEKAGVKITYLPFIIKAFIATIREFPMFNASIDDAAAEIVYKKYFNIGFAADTPNGLLVPVIKNADKKTIMDLSREIIQLATKARDGKLSLDEMKGATITITNIGSIGGVYATPIINHPEVAILGMYKIVDKPLYINGKFRHAKVMNYTITCDHRLIDGAVAANFMSSFAARLENPSHLMLDMM